MRTSLACVLLACAAVAAAACGPGDQTADTGGDSGVRRDTGSVQDTGGGSDVVLSDTPVGMDSPAPGMDVLDMDAPAADTAGDATGVDRVARDIVLMATPNSVYCFRAGPCTGATPVCCTSTMDGGLVDRCVASSMSCSGRAVACDDGTDCAMGTVCCANIRVRDGGTPTLESSACAATCPAGDVRFCSSSGECPTGQTCMPERISGRDVGVCR